MCFKLFFFQNGRWHFSFFSGVCFWNMSLFCRFFDFRLCASFSKQPRTTPRTLRRNNEENAAKVMAQDPTAPNTPPKKGVHPNGGVVCAKLRQVGIPRETPCRMSDFFDAMLDVNFSEKVGLNPCNSMIINWICFSFPKICKNRPCPTTDQLPDPTIQMDIGDEEALERVRGL